jgi:hypothetical protein
MVAEAFSTWDIPKQIFMLYEIGSKLLTILAS